MRNARRITGLAAMLAVLCLTAACSDSGDDPEPIVTVTETETEVVTPEPTAPAEPSPAGEGVDAAATDPFTALVVEMVWTQKSDSDKSDFCGGLGLFGAENVADLFRENGTDGSDEVDEDLAVEILEDKCREEGYLTS